jgi:hypothetical protein
MLLRKQRKFISKVKIIDKGDKMATKFPTIPVIMIVLGLGWLLESLLKIDIPIFAILLILIGTIWLVNSLVKKR